MWHNLSPEFSESNFIEEEHGHEYCSRDSNHWEIKGDTNDDDNDGTSKPKRVVRE